ncbi:MAG: hypothetical protein VX500_01505 [Planctomycetota bacterium]|nr:hypothetical protein [Planctomycetota bacterium]
MLANNWQVHPQICYKLTHSLRTSPGTMFPARTTAWDGGSQLFRLESPSLLLMTEDHCHCVKRRVSVKHDPKLRPTNGATPRPKRLAPSQFLEFE